MESLFLDHLQLNHFKNYANEHFSFIRGFNIITGKNGMGKTNVLDAIYYQSVFKSYFAKKDSDLIQKGNDYFRIEGNWEVREEKIKVAQAYRDGQKLFFLNGQKDAMKSDFIGQIPVVLICPEDQLMIREGSRVRRKIFDHILSLTNHKYLRCLMQYNRLLRQRNQYLKTTPKHKILYDVLLTYSRQMNTMATFIHESRSQLTDNFKQQFPKDYQDLSDSSETCDIHYKSSMFDGSLEYLHEQDLEKDIVLGRTNAGIHKDDWAFGIDGERIKYFGSQGQQKTFVLAIKFGLCRQLMNEKKIIPLLLLDDIFDKLDPHRMNLLVSWLYQSPFKQVLITDTDENRLWDLIKNLGKNQKKFVVNNGKIKDETTR